MQEEVKCIKDIKSVKDIESVKDVRSVNDIIIDDFEDDEESATQVRTKRHLLKLIPE
jgi:hypothetical protein